MDVSIGKALREARLKKGITLEEAARATKIHPERIADLERDEYRRFASLAYARGFLVLYAKHVGVDISKYPAPEAGSPVLSADYTYLENNDRGITSLRFSERQRRPRQRRKWWIGGVVFAGATAIASLFFLMVLDFLRLPSLDELLQMQGRPAEEEIAPESLPAPTPEATPEPTPDLAPEPTPEPTPEPAPQEAGVLEEEVIPRAVPVDASPPLSPFLQAPAAPLEEEPAIPRAQPVHPGDVVAALPAAQPRELRVSGLKRTRVKIFRDSVDSPPVYDGWVVPGGAPVTFRGANFHIVTPDRPGISVELDGDVIPGSGSVEAGVEIQTQ